MANGCSQKPPVKRPPPSPRELAILAAAVALIILALGGIRITVHGPVRVQINGR